MKENLRAQMLSQRRAQSAHEAHIAQITIRDLFLKAQFNLTYTSIGGYISMRHEISPQLILEHCHATGCTTALPVIDTTHIQGFAHWEPGNALVDGPMGTRQPKGPHTFITPQLVLLPALAVDYRGNRLGYGKGFYDQWLNHCQSPPLCMAIIYTFQLVDTIASSTHDYPVDFILTPEKIIQV